MTEDVPRDAGITSDVVDVHMLVDTASPTDEGPQADVGTNDVGAPDTGPLDSGVLDVGPSDVGTLDSGTPDVGTPDVGVPDVNASDATPVDANAQVAVGSRRAGRFSTLGVRAWQVGATRIVDDEIEAGGRACGVVGGAMTCVSGGFLR